MEYTLESMFGIKDRVIVVTGGVGGIGKGVCEGLCALGARVAIIDVNQDKIDEAVAEFAQKGWTARGYATDITQEESVEKTFAQIDEDFGSVYGLANFAGISHVEYLSGMSIDKWQAVMDVNLRGTVICTKVAGKYMEKGGVGRVINISSLAATHGKPKYTAYTPSKAAVNAFTFTLAAEWGRKNITVNAISPVMVVTDINRKQVESDPEFLRTILNNSPQGRLCSPDLLLGLVVYMLSDSSSFLTGQCIGCDGGAQNGEIGVFKPEGYVEQ